MKRCAALHLALCVLVMAAAGVVVIVGCKSSNDSIGSGGQCIWQDIVYAGNRYICTSVIVASQKTGTETPSNVMYTGSISEAGEYDVYLIEGVDENEAIAIKQGRWGGFSYIKYERLYGQEEPADFVYDGRDYDGTGEIVATQRASHPAAGTPEAVGYLSSVVYQGTTYDVYSIQGVDENQAIALRIAKAGTTVGFYYYYFKYEGR
jgi:hypothetical protein